MAVLSWIFNRSLNALERKQEDHDNRIRSCEMVNGKVLVCLENVDEKLDDLKMITQDTARELRERRGND